MQTETSERLEQIDTSGPTATTAAFSATKTAPQRPHFARRNYLVDARSQLPFVAFVFGVSLTFAMLVNVLVRDLTIDAKEIQARIPPMTNRVVHMRTESFRTYAMVSSLVIVFASMVVSLSMTHRTAGCIVNLRNKMQRVTDGQLGQQVRFRKHDTLPQLAESFNIMTRALAARAQSEAETLQQLATTAERLAPQAEGQRLAAALQRLAVEKDLAAGSRAQGA